MILKRVFFVLHLGKCLEDCSLNLAGEGVILPSGNSLSESETVYGIAGMPLTLPCRKNYGKEKIEAVVWMYDKQVVFRNNIGGHPFKGPTFLAYEVKDIERGKFYLVIPEAVEGTYTCDANSKKSHFHLRVLTATRSHDGFLLEGETLELKLNFPDKDSIKQIEWYDPHNVNVISNKRCILKDKRWSLQIMNLHSQEDNGTWECRIPGLNITYDVKVIGFKNIPDAEVMYAVINSRVNLTYPLNVKLRDVPGISEVLIRKLTKDNLNDLKMSMSIPINSTIPFKEIPSVQFKDAGQYQCQLRMSQRTLNMSIHLVVMKVSAQPLQLNSTDANLTLCCYISAPSDPMGQLNWVHMNRTHYSERANTLCISTGTAGLWKCSLLVNEHEKITTDYVVTVDEDPGGQGKDSAVHNTFPVVVVGVVSPLLLLILIGTCLLVCKTVVRKRQQAKRMIQAKEHLLAKRTCQCQKDLTNDYYHA